MFDCIKDIRRDYGFGRAIAAPQIGVQKRLICILTDKLYIIINPELEFIGDEMMELMDDCMSFPNLLVRVRRYRHCILRYLDMVVDDLKSKRITPIYLITDYTSFYKKYGWKFLYMVQGDDETDMTRMYIHR